jgi:hypothetical protein
MLGMGLASGTFGQDGRRAVDFIREARMKTLELALVIVAAVGLMFWRGVSMYRYGLRRKAL